MITQYRDSPFHRRAPISVNESQRKRKMGAHKTDTTTVKANAGVIVLVMVLGSSSPDKTCHVVGASGLGGDLAV